MAHGFNFILYDDLRREVFCKYFGYGVLKRFLLLHHVCNATQHNATQVHDMFWLRLTKQVGRKQKLHFETGIQIWLDTWIYLFYVNILITLSITMHLLVTDLWSVFALSFCNNCEFKSSLENPTTSGRRRFVCMLG